MTAASLKRIASYLAVQNRFSSIAEVERYLREVHQHFGALTNEQWRHLATHSGVSESDGTLRLHYDPTIARQFTWPWMVDINLWHVWDRVACPVLVLRGAQSDLLLAGTVRDMLRRGTAARLGLVEARQVDGCGHAPALMDDDVLETVYRFLQGSRHAAADDAAGGMR